MTIAQKKKKRSKSKKTMKSLHLMTSLGIKQRKMNNLINQKIRNSKKIRQKVIRNQKMINKTKNILINY